MSRLVEYNKQRLQRLCLRLWQRSNDVKEHPLLLVYWNTPSIALHYWAKVNVEDVDTRPGSPRREEASTFGLPELFELFATCLVHFRSGFSVGLVKTITLVVHALCKQFHKFVLGRIRKAILKQRNQAPRISKQEWC